MAARVSRKGCKATFSGLGRRGRRVCASAEGTSKVRRATARKILAARGQSVGFASPEFMHLTKAVPGPRKLVFLKLPYTKCFDRKCALASSRPSSAQNAAEKAKWPFDERPLIVWEGIRGTLVSSSRTACGT